MIALGLVLCVPCAVKAQTILEDVPQDEVSARVPIEAPDEGTTLEVYDIADLTGYDAYAKLEPVQEKLAGGNDPDQILAELERRQELLDRAEQAAQDLIDVIQAYMDPVMQGEEQQLRAVESKLLVAVVTPTQHEWLRSFMKAQRVHVGLISIDTHVFFGEIGSFASIGVKERSKVLATDAELERLLRGVRDSKIELQQAPRISAFARQRASVSTLKEIAYVQDWAIETVQPGNQKIADPQIGVVHDGIQIDLRAVPLPGGEQSYGVEIDMTSSTVSEPIATFDVTLATGQKVTIGLPEITKIRFDTRLSLTSGSSLLFVVDDEQNEREIGIAVRVTKQPWDVNEAERTGR